MRKGVLALASAGAFGLLLGSAVTASAQSPASATISLACLSAGGAQTVTVNAPAGTEVAVQVGGGTGSTTGVTDAQGKFVDSFTVASSASGTVGVLVFAFLSEGLATGESSFNVVSAQASPCPTTSDNTRSFGVNVIEATQISPQVKKTCAAAVSGSASFALTFTSEAGTFVLPVKLSAACNGTAATLPKVPVGTIFKLHEATPPTNGVPAADVTIVVQAASTTTINNLAASVPTPTPTTRVLANTGGGSENPMLPWPVVVLGALLASVGAGLLIRRRTG